MLATTRRLLSLGQFNGYRNAKREITHHSRNTLHDNQNDTAEEEEDGKDDDQEDGAADASHLEGVGHGHGPEHSRQLLVGERQCPETEVRGRVRDTVEAEFYSDRTSANDQEQ